jgi:hypothetical protein
MKNLGSKIRGFLFSEIHFLYLSDVTSHFIDFKNVIENARARFGFPISRSEFDLHPLKGGYHEFGKERSP